MPPKIDNVNHKIAKNNKDRIENTKPPNTIHRNTRANTSKKTPLLGGVLLCVLLCVSRFLLAVAVWRAAEVSYYQLITGDNDSYSCSAKTKDPVRDTVQYS